MEKTKYQKAYLLTIANQEVNNRYGTDRIYDITADLLS